MKEIVADYHNSRKVTLNKTPPNDQKLLYICNKKISGTNQYRE